MPSVSVIIPSYNTSRYLPAALESVLAQTFEDWEAIIVDDGSTDNTKDIVDRLRPQFSGRLHYYYQANRGLPAARNAAIMRAAGEFIALLDADDVWMPDRLACGVEHLRRHPAIGFVHARVARIDAAGRIIEYPGIRPPRFLSGKIADYIYDRRAHVLCPTVLVRRRCFDDVGLFDEQMRATEDRDMWYRIASRFPVGFENKILAHYRITPTSMSSDFSRMLTAQQYFIDKHNPGGFRGRVRAHRALANLYRERGDALFREGRTRASLSWYGRSLLYFPFESSNVYMFLRALAEPAIRQPITLIRDLQRSSRDV